MSADSQMALATDTAGSAKLKRRIVLWLSGIVLGAVVIGWLVLSEAVCKVSPEVRTEQGCVNQGADCRIAGTVVCWMQRQLSWKSEKRPNLLRIGPKRRAHLAFAWPPYVVYNSPQPNGRWRVFRVGFRYDRNWRGYIFPTAAWKYMDSALEY